MGEECSVFSVQCSVAGGWWLVAGGWWLGVLDFQEFIPMNSLAPAIY